MRDLNGLIGLIFLGFVFWLVAGWLNIPLTLNLDAWICIITLCWLYFIVTVPWNLYFQAHQILVDAAQSVARGISVQPDALKYAERWSRRALWLALGLHLLTALVLAGIALAGISLLGWVGAGAALVLSLLRPGWRAYLYVRDRLRHIGAEIEVPREDALELKRRLAEAESMLNNLQQMLDTAQHGTLMHGITQRLTQLEERATSNEDQQRDFAEQQRLELQRVERDAKNTVAQVLGDAAIVGHVRELVQFFKRA